MCGFSARGARQAFVPHYLVLLIYTYVCGTEENRLFVIFNLTTHSTGLVCQFRNLEHEIQPIIYSLDCCYCTVHYTYRAGYWRLYFQCCFALIINVELVGTPRSSTQLVVKIVIWDISIEQAAIEWTIKMNAIETSRDKTNILDFSVSGILTLYLYPPETECVEPDQSVRTAQAYLDRYITQRP